MFAFGLTTLALREFLPSRRPEEALRAQKRQERGIFLLVLAGVIFRSEVALLLGTQALYMLIYPRISLENILSTGVKSALVSLFISISIDSYFWQFPVWPELAGFYFNAIKGRSSEWGVSPIYYYFTHLLPKLLLNPFVYFILIPLGSWITATKYQVRELTVPSLLFIAIYSLQRHKEARFIIYAVPPLTAAGSCAASYFWNRRAKNLFHHLFAFLLVVSVLSSALVSTALLVISSLNYPGGHALSLLHTIIQETSLVEDPQRLRPLVIHMDVLSCMTGVTRFLELPTRSGTTRGFTYDKTEDLALLRQPEWWTHVDYALMEDPTLAIGQWDTLATVFAYSGIEILRPEDRLAPSDDNKSEHIHRDEKRQQEKRVTNAARGSTMATDHVLNALQNIDSWRWIRERVRQRTNGWWIGPRLVPKIHILNRVTEKVSAQPG
ncbi:hypothetical protein K3495_g3051 [Podosphaera aphanis]|nr:hypothetical protein K3495_g3051 [Podosphaera aphanis]